uniref:Caprin-2 n=1 Tax=Pelusios castaneus TaxID=367368 RepID=A0A8C8RVE1_9SAUR
MKPVKQQVTSGQSGESTPPLSPLQSALNSATTPSQAYETYIDNGLICLKHKIRNIEKKKLKLEDYRDRLKKGETLNQDQLEAVEKYEEVIHNLEFAKELQKTFSGLSQDLLKAQKKAQRRESIMKLEAEKKKLRTILQVQYVLQNFTQEHVQKDFKGGLNGAIYLPSKELDYLIRFANLTCVERHGSLSVEDQMEQSSLYFWDLLEGSEKAVVGTTYKHMKELLSKLLNSGYFENIPAPRNIQVKEELEEEVRKKSERTRQLPKGETVKEPEPLMKLMQSEIQPQEFLNRRYLPEAECLIKNPEECKPWEAEYTRKQEPPKSWEMLVDIEQEQKKQKQESLKPWESCIKQQEQKKLESPKLWEARVKEEEGQKQECSKPWEISVKEEEQKKQETPKPWVMHIREEQDSPKPWVTRVREEQDQRKQESSPRPWLQNTPKSWGAASLGQKEQVGPKKIDVEPKDLPKPGHQSTAEFCSTSTLPKDPILRREKLQDLMTQIQGTYNFMQVRVQGSDPHCISGNAVKLLVTLFHYWNGTTIPMSSEPQSPLPITSNTSISPVPQGQTFQSPPASSSSVTINAAPFQAMQTVFKVNAPLPPRKEQEIKDDSSYPSGYNQSFSTASTQTPPQCQLQSTHAAEQNALSQEALPTVNYQPDGAVPISNGNLAFYPAQTVFPRPTQPYLNNRGSVRGSARGGRSVTNSYRSPGGYKGFDPYRGSPSIPNGNYGQLQFSGRDYPGMPYSQRDANYQQCYKRGVMGGTRSNSRAGWSDSSQVSSPERDNDTFNSGDSGQGDSRSITPVEMPVTSQAATLLPVHVYPLPQQMRVAFSAARTSNLAPGTLDQPIVFDLLLNNLGETFDIQLGRFNCPVNGTYVFIFHMLKLAVNVPLYVNLMKNEEVLVSAYANDGAPDHETASNHAVLQLFQGDQIWLRLHRGAIYGSSWKYSTFSGYLLYQD